MEKRAIGEESGAKEGDFGGRDQSRGDLGDVRGRGCDVGGRWEQNVRE